jgi:hypothetical protein
MFMQLIMLCAVKTFGLKYLKMKPQQLKKLLIFTLISFFCFTAKAQISYTDVKPDAKRSCNSSPCDNAYNIDLNNDGINDFVINAKEAASFQCPNLTDIGVYITSLDSNSVVTYNSHPLMLILNTPIYNQSVYTLNSPLSLRTIVWIFNRTTRFCSGVNTGLWLSDSDGYIGLKLKKGNNVYYGWIRLSVSVSYTVSDSFTIKDYAYNSVPNQPILAGEKSCNSPTVTLSASGPLSFCNGDSVKFTANGSGYLYQWKKNGVNISGATSQTYTAKTAGTYKCFVTNSCGSIASTGKKVTLTCKGSFINTEISNEKIISQATHLKIAPNPFSNSTTISFTLPQSQIVSISIYDVNGRLIKTLADAQMQQGAHQLIWNAKDEKGNAVTVGIYFLRMQSENYTGTKKLVVVK